jgi:hypothetical protein
MFTNHLITSEIVRQEIDRERRTRSRPSWDSRNRWLPRRRFGGRPTSVDRPQPRWLA